MLRLHFNSLLGQLETDPEYQTVDKSDLYVNSRNTIYSVYSMFTLQQYKRERIERGVFARVVYIVYVI